MAHKYFADQFDDEEVLFVFRKHPVVMRKGLVIGLLALLLGALVGLGWTMHGASLGQFYMSMLAGFVLGLLVFLPFWISWYFSVFIVTDQRLIQTTQKGLFHRSIVDMGLSQIQMVNYQVDGLMQTMLGSGTIMMQTFVGDLIIHNVHHPAAIQKKLLEVLRERGVNANPYGNKDPRETIQEEAEEA